MIALTVDFAGRQQALQFEQRILLSDALQLHHLPLDLPCAGKGRCRQCRVYASGELSPLSAIERQYLTKQELAQGVRLACLTYAEGAAEVQCISGETLENIVTSGVMPDFVRKPIAQGYGLAVDIGTTTVAVQLYRLSDCDAMQTVCMKNPQSIFGADVISRIEQSLNGKGEALFRSISDAINGMAHKIAAAAKIDAEQIEALVITGNTAMLYLLTRQDVNCLSHAPFEAERLFGEWVGAQELGISVGAQAQVYLPRCISAFVGADITTAILASNLHKQDKTLLVDIGTNGEIALYHKGKLYCCSTAAGPAFEGAGIHMGVNGIRGAIDTVSLQDGRIVCTTIDGVPAVGICGSGIIDAIAVLCEAQVIDETGGIQEDGHAFAHLLEHTDGGLSVRINAKNILLTQKDIRMVQLAKSAISAGIQTLAAAAEIALEEIDRLYIAGGFGSYINLKNAARIGLIPAALADKAVVIGNAAASGAAMILQNADFITESFHLAQDTQTVDLTTNPLFMDYYVDGMTFGDEEL